MRDLLPMTVVLAIAIIGFFVNVGVLVIDNKKLRNTEKQLATAKAQIREYEYKMNQPDIKVLYTLRICS